MPLTRDQILTSLDLPMETVDVPRWGGEVLVKAMPMGHPRYTLYTTGNHQETNGGKSPLPAREEFVRRMVGAVIMSALDPETEKPMFKWEDADALREKHWQSVIAVANKAFELAADPDTPTTEEEEPAEEPTPALVAVPDSDEDAPDGPLAD